MSIETKHFDPQMSINRDVRLIVEKMLEENLPTSQRNLENIQFRLHEVGIVYSDENVRIALHAQTNPLYWNKVTCFLCATKGMQGEMVDVRDSGIFWWDGCKETSKRREARHA